MALKGFRLLKRSKWVSEQLLDCCITLHVDSDAGFENVQRGHGLSTAFICDWKMNPTIHEHHNRRRTDLSGPAALATFMSM